ncbi:MAG: hypothetical protein ACI4P0_04235, partial [Mailhella sp.]
MTTETVFEKHFHVLKSAVLDVLGPISPRALQRLTDIPEMRWISDFAYENPFPLSFQKISLSKTIAGIPEGTKFFQSFIGSKGFFFHALSLAACGKELEALNVLINLAAKIQSTAGPEPVNAIVILLVRAFLGHKISLEQ